MLGGPRLPQQTRNSAQDHAAQEDADDDNDRDEDGGLSLLGRRWEACRRGFVDTDAGFR